VVLAVVHDRSEAVQQLRQLLRTEVVGPRPSVVADHVRDDRCRAEVLGQVEAAEPRVEHRAVGLRRGRDSDAERDRLDVAVPLPERSGELDELLTAGGA
jgi:hypothetical protein